jgi:hypothetical protein
MILLDLGRLFACQPDWIGLNPVTKQALTDIDFD